VDTVGHGPQVISEWSRGELESELTVEIEIVAKIGSSLQRCPIGLRMKLLPQDLMPIGQYGECCTCQLREALMELDIITDAQHKILVMTFILAN